MFSSLKKLKRSFVIKYALFLVSARIICTDGTPICVITDVINTAFAEYVKQFIGPAFFILSDIFTKIQIVI